MKLLGLIGYPLSHSFSKKYFTEKFEKENISGYRYELFPLELIDQLPELISSRPDLCGLNVTIPHKISVMKFMDELDISAREAGAVNTILIRHLPGKKTYLKGYNTDVYGFEATLKPLLQSHHYKALILGTGGASRAVAWVLKKTGIDFLFVSRTAGKNSQTVSYRELNDTAVRNFPLIINTTPVGMHPNEENCPSIPYEHLSPKNFLYDLVYNPEETLFLKKGKEKGAIIQNGLPMLKLQAERAWEIWNPNN